MKFKRSLLLLLVLIVLVSCTPVPHAIPTNTAIPTRTLIPMTLPPTSMLTPTPEGIELQPVIEDLWVHGMTIGLDGTLWLLASGEITDGKASLVNLDNGNITVYKAPNCIATSCGSNTHFSDLIADIKGALWVSTGYGIYKFDGTNWTSYLQDDGIPKDFIPTIASDSAGNLWVGTEFGDVSRFDGKTWLLYEKDEGTKLDSVKDIVVLSDGSIWFGGIGGVARFDGTTWKTYRTKDNLNRDIHIWDLAVTKYDTILVINSWGDPTVVEFDGEEWRAIDGFPSNLHTIYIDSKGYFWFGGRGRISYFDGTWSELLIPSVYEPFVFDIAETSDGTIWLATPNGLYSTAN